MPSKIDPVTGEKQEVSMEEFMRAIRESNGTVGIQQVVTDASGKETVTDVYGNMSGANDGLDRSVNVFVDNDSVISFIKSAFDGSIPEPEDDEKKFKGYVMTVDILDQAITWVMTNTEEKVALSAFVRDERKSNTREIDSGEWNKENGHLTVDKEKLKSDEKLLHMIGFNQIRKYLKNQGLVEELRELDNRSAGVVVSATDGTFSAKIVRGKNRPELPCNMLFLGEQMCRPYMDELMTGAMLSSMTIEEQAAAAESGDPDCMENLAQAYLNGDGVEQDFGKSAYWWKKLAETGNAIGQFNIGLYYAKGCGVERDYKEAVEWLEKAAENGDEDAPELIERYGGAAETLKKAESGDAAAQAEMSKLSMMLGNSLYQFGAGKDFQEAFKWAQRATDQGNLDGMYCLALCYEHGRGTAVDHAKAADIYEKAAEQGHAPSQWNLAVCYLNGMGREWDSGKGIEWAYKAADQGYELAIDGLETNGRSVAKIIERYSSPETDITLEGTQYEGRADRCERITAGTKLTYSMGKDRHGEEALECFYNGGSVGLIPKWAAGEVITLLKMDRVALSITVKSCIPKSQRGARARNADVHLALQLTEKKPKTPEEREAEEKAERLRKEASDRAAREAAERQAEEERKKREESARIAEAERKRKEEVERLAAEQRRREEETARKAEEERQKKLREAREKEEARRREQAAKQENYKNEVSSWIAQVKSVLKQQGEAKKAEGEKAYQDMLAGFERESTDLQARIEQLRKERNDTQTALDALGLFKFSEKKPLKEKIKEIEASILKCSAQLKEIPQKREQAEKNSYAFKVKAAKEAEKKVEKQIPAPAFPMRSGKTVEWDKLKKTVFDAAVRHEKRSDIVLVCNDYPEEVVKFVLDELRSEGKLIRTEERGEAYYTEP